MTEKLGDWEIEKDLLGICVIASSGIPIKEKGLYGEIVKVILSDRKHQKSEMLKRLPSDEKVKTTIIDIAKKVYVKNRKTIVLEFDSRALNRLVKAIHKLAEDKLKEE